MKLYSRKTKQKEIFVPIDENQVNMYVCGPTLYDDIHLGNVRNLLVFDLLYKVLKRKYNKVNYVRNVTDIDDKIIDKLDLTTNCKPRQVLKGFTQLQYARFFTIQNTLKMVTRFHATEVFVTHCMEEIRDTINELVQLDKAYVVNNHVFFRVNSIDNNDLLNPSNSNLNCRENEFNHLKNDYRDFVLWKPSKSDIEPSWISPCGILKPGRPGWHVECYAIINNYFSHLDIHGGGDDLLFPHHECEHMISMAHNSRHLANYWVHNAQLKIDNQKMAKSLGNVIKVKDVLAQYSGETLIFTLLKSHYRHPMHITMDMFAESEKILNKFSQKVGHVGKSEPSEFFDALDNDLNTPHAISIIHGYYRNKEYSNLEASLRFLIGV